MSDERLQRDLEAFRSLTGIPAQALSPEESAPALFDCACCAILARSLPDQHYCHRQHQRAAELSRNLGETYLFACHSGLFHAVVPAGDHRFVLAGPFSLEEADPSLVPESMAGVRFSEGDLMEMREFQARTRVLSVNETGHLCTMLYDLFSERQADNSDTLRNRHRQQQRIAEALQSRKLQHKSAAARYPLEKEDKLIRYVREGDSARADAMLNDLLGYAFFASPGLENVRAYTAELCALLTRAAIEGGAQSADTIMQSQNMLHTLWRMDSIEEICYFMQEMVERFCESAFSRRRTGEQETVQKAIRYIHMHYSEPLTLNVLAKETHLSPSYFSTVFKRGSGSGFREYLSSVRIDRAKELLEKSGMDVTEVARATGFDSQSYFSKVFHAAIGLSPTDYRQRSKK